MTVDIPILWIIVPVGIFLGSYLVRYVYGEVKKKREQKEQNRRERDRQNKRWFEEQLRDTLPGEWYQLYEILNECEERETAYAVLDKFTYGGRDYGGRIFKKRPKLSPAGMEVILRKVDHGAAVDLLKPYLDLGLNTPSEKGKHSD